MRALAVYPPRRPTALNNPAQPRPGTGSHMANTTHSSSSGDCCSQPRRRRLDRGARRGRSLSPITNAPLCCLSPIRILGPAVQRRIEGSVWRRLPTTSLRAHQSSTSSARHGRSSWPTLRIVPPAAAIVTLIPRRHLLDCGAPSCFRPAFDPQPQASASRPLPRSSSHPSSRDGAAGRVGHGNRRFPTSLPPLLR